MTFTAQNKSATKQLTLLYGQPTRTKTIGDYHEVVYNHNMSKTYPTRYIEVGVWEGIERLPIKEEKRILIEKHNYNDFVNEYEMFNLLQVWNE